eukprot:5618903-Ditylum_brightwellii.AAC.1
MALRMVCERILPLFQSYRVIKLIHDLRDGMVAPSHMGIEGCNMMCDTQLAAEYLTGDPFVGVDALLLLFGVSEHPLKEKMKGTKDHVEYAGLDAGLLFKVAPTLSAKFVKNKCEVEDLMNLLLEDLFSKLVQKGTHIPTYTAEYNLVDINLDVGRRACC